MRHARLGPHDMPIGAFALRWSAMAIDTRDWYRDLLRKKTRYVERARFRMGHDEVARHKHAKAWRGNWIKLGIFLVLLAVLIWFKR